MSLPATPPWIGSRSGFIQGGNRPSRLPKAPPWVSPSFRQSEELPPVSQQGQWGNGYTNDQLLKMFTSQDDQPLPPQAPQDLQQPIPAPSKPVRSDNPFAKENLSRTLLDMSAAFLGNQQSFGAGLGAAAQSIGNRSDELHKLNTPKVEYGGPEDQFEITTDPRTGNRQVRQVPEFTKAVQEARAAKNTLTPKDALDARARAVYQISQLPPEQRAEAYRDLRANPEQYGISAQGMPMVWDDTYGKVAGRMGQSVSQAEAQVLRSQAFQHRQFVDSRRLQQGDARIQQGAARVHQGAARLTTTGRTKTTTKAPAGFNWDN